MKHKSKTFTILFLALSLLLTGCGSTKSTNLESSLDDDQAAREDVTTPTPGAGVLTECTPFDDVGSDLSGRLTTFFDPVTASTVLDRIRLELRSTPTYLTNGSNSYVQFFKWHGDDRNAATIDEAPVQVRFQSHATGAIYSTSTRIVQISQNTITQIINSQNLSNAGITVNNFLSQHTVILEDVGLAWDALKVVQFDAKDRVQQDFDVLMPAYSANPNTYARTHLNPLLNMIHPNVDLANQFLTDDVYLTRLYQRCSFN